MGFVFPFESIPKDKRIIVYGAGYYGKMLWEINRDIHWCVMETFIDQNDKQKTNFPVPVFGLDRLKSISEYDYIYIAIINDDIRMEVRERLVNLGIEETKIISHKPMEAYKDSYMDVVISNIDESEEHTISMGYAIGEPIGDQIISLKVYQAICELAQDISITVYGGNTVNTDAIYYGQSNLNEIRHYYPGEDEIRQYDLFIYAEFLPRLKLFNSCRLRKYAPLLYDAINKIYRYQIECSPGNAVSVYQSRIILDRAKFMGKTRYTMLDCNGAFDIKDDKVEIIINNSFYDEYKKNKPTNGFITVHYGASDVMKNGKLQTKIWPLDYYEKLCELVKRENKGITIIQLGGNGEPRIQGADINFMGESLELSKYVLRDAICHIDCESGLVHLATQLGTKCIVLFGPTPVWFFGYKENVNISPKECGGCKGLLKDWYTHCIKYEQPRCMLSIRPEMVAEEANKLLKGRR